MNVFTRSIFFLCFLILGLSATAQTFTGMLVGGVNLSQIDGDRLNGFNKVGFNVGARVGVNFSERWQLSTEMLFSQQGADRTPGDDISSVYDNIKLNFVEVPVMMNFKDWKILASAGLSYNRLINSTVISDTGEDISELEIYNPNIVAIVLGATYQFSEKWGLNIRWSRHLNSLRESVDMIVQPVDFVGKNVGIRVFYVL